MIPGTHPKFHIPEVVTADLERDIDVIAIFIFADNDSTGECSIVVVVLGAAVSVATYPTPPFVHSPLPLKQSRMILMFLLALLALLFYMLFQTYQSSAKSMSMHVLG